MPEYPQNSESILAPERLGAGLPWKIFIFALILFGTIVGSYLGLTVGYRPYLDSRIGVVQAEIDALAQSIPVDEQTNFLRFYSQIVNLKTLLDSHIVFARFFPFLEKNTNQQVAYEVATLITDKGEMVLEGVAQSYGVLAEQLEAMNQSLEVKDYILNQSQIAEGKIRFRIVAALDGRLFKQE